MMALIKSDTVTRALLFLMLFHVVISSVSSTFLQYSREDLLRLRQDPFSQSDGFGLNESQFSVDWPTDAPWNEPKPNVRPTRKRGRRGGKLVKLRRRHQNTPVPSIILVNVQRLFNKTGELFSRIANFRDYADCNVFCLTETWLTTDHPDCILQPPGFTIYRHDRDRQITGKSQGGGVCFLINNNWCKDVRIISQGTTRIWNIS
ncbi:hypothetical protein BSL78_21685 [Apostichopus japonicus]|uniref:Uncharacterized protein n=1 Tax=Stichopus japonicus TaxID=307972 RepID=A0A2G8K0C4_STIJA|nr:hypothetical protein BSL78_21685 [Apostichopus japonicus]